MRGYGIDAAAMSQAVPVRVKAAIINPSQGQAIRLPQRHVNSKYIISQSVDIAR